MIDNKMENHFIVDNISPEWRSFVEDIKLPDTDIEKQQTDFDIKPLWEFLSEDDSFVNIATPLSDTDMLLKSSEVLKEEIRNCGNILETAEKKRREIASNAELIHGECDSQMTSEQRLTVFVQSIDSILIYFEDLDRISLDFKSNLFNVLSPDFPLDLEKIENGIRFFEANSNYKDAKAYLLKYQLLQGRAVEIIKDYVKLTLSRLSLRISTSKDDDENKIYVKYMSVAPMIKRIFRLSEKTIGFGDVLGIYRSSRIDLLSPILSIPILEPKEIRTFASKILTYVRKEYELAREFFNFDGHPLYVKCFCDLISDIGQIFCDNCCSLLTKILDINVLCEIFIMLKGDVLQEEISRIPLAAEKLRNHFLYVLGQAEERLMFRIEIINGEKAINSDQAIKLLSLIYYALPRESFVISASNLLKTYMKNITLESSKYKEDSIEKSLFLLDNYLILHEKLKNFDCQIVGTTQSFDFEPLSDFLWRLLQFDSSVYKLNGERGLIKSVSKLSRIISSTFDVRKELENEICLSFKSLTSYSTQLLIQPLLNLENRQRKEKSLILSAFEGINEAIKEHFQTCIGDKLNEIIKNQSERNAILDVLRSHLTRTVNDCVSSFGEIDQETKESLEKLLDTINKL